MKQQILKAAIFLPSLAFGIYYYGIVGAAWAILINKVIVVLVAQYTFSFLITVKISMVEFIIALKAPLTAAVASFIITYLLNMIGVNYLICGLSLVLVYSGIIYLMMGSELKNVIKGFKKK
jgi:hypothetical protein